MGVSFWRMTGDQKKLIWSENETCEIDTEAGESSRSLPLVTGSGRVDRVLELQIDSRELQLLREAPLLMEWHEEVLGTIAEVLALTLENLKLHAQLEAQALLDPLTGVSNRLYLTGQLEKEVVRSRRDQQPLGLLFTDLDGFKRMMSLGMKDDLLIEVSHFLQHHFRESDHLAAMAVMSSS